MKVFESVPQMLHARIAETPDAVAWRYRRGGAWTSCTWQQFGEQVRSVACGLLALGLEHGDRVGILAATRVEWIEADLGVMCAGGAVTTVYPSNTAAECAFLLGDSGARLCFVEDDEQAAKLLQARDDLPELEQVVVFDGAPTDDGFVMTWADLLARGEAWDAEHPEGYEQASAVPGPDDLATLIYTSGTTGRPKGVMLAHDCWCFTAESVAQVIDEVLEPGDEQYLFLPLSHSYGKVLELIAIRMGFPTAVDGDIEYLVQGLREVRPTFVGAVPRVFEKVYTKIVTGAQEKGGLTWRLFQWAVGVGSRVSALRRAGEQPGGWLSLQYAVADRLVFRKLREALGGRMKAFVSAGAPLSRDIGEFFHAAGILILEGYGLTESAAASVLSRMDDFKFGAVGKPAPGVELRIADDGEVLLRGRGILRGYYNLPEATAEAIDDDGWFHTGDLGSLDDDGFLHITGRKKELIITAGGKNIAPSHAENRIKSQCPYVSQVIMHGDRRNFCVALVTIDEEAVAGWAERRGLAFGDYASLAALPDVHDLVWGYVEQVNADLPSYETIKYIALLDHDLGVESGELTPSLKVKRRVVEERNKDLLDGFYEGATAELVG